MNGLLLFGLKLYLLFFSVWLRYSILFVSSSDERIIKRLGPSFRPGLSGLTGSSSCISQYACLRPSTIRVYL